MFLFASPAVLTTAPPCCCPLDGDTAAIKIANEDAETSKRALRRYLVTSDAAILDEAYQTFRGMFPRVPYVTEEQIKSSLALSENPKAAGANPKDFFDTHFLKEIEDSGFVQELYGKRYAVLSGG